MPFCINTLLNIFVIRTFSAKTCILVLSGDGALRPFAHDFCLMGCAFGAFFWPGGGDFALSKKFPWDGPGKC